MTWWVSLGLSLKIIAPGLLFILLHVITLAALPVLSGSRFPSVKTGTGAMSSKCTDPTRGGQMLLAAMFWSLLDGLLNFLEYCA